MVKSPAHCTARKHHHHASRFWLKVLTSATTSYLCVEKGIRVTPEVFYGTVKRRNQELFQCAWGASEFRQGMITLGREFISPNETFPSCADDLLAEAADHSTEVDLAHYAIVQGAVPRLSNSSLAQHRWLGREWSSLLGMGPQKPPEPVYARGMSEKVMVPAELALQISGVVADAVMNKLATIGLTAENIKKLENLGQMPPVDAAGGGLQASHLTDRVSSKLAAVSVREKNIKKLATSGGGTSAEGLQVARSPLHLDDVADTSVLPSSFFTENSFDTSESTSNNTSPMQFYRKRKRAAMPQVFTREETMLPQPKRTRHNGISCEQDEFLMDDEGQVDCFPARYSSPLVSNLPGYTAENILMEYVQHRDQVQDNLLRENVRGAIQKLLQNSNACEKNKSQMEAILLIMRKRQDGLITMRTGGGKSMLWLIPPLLDPEVHFIVVCPFTVLLNQHCESALRHGLRAIDYGVGDIPQDVQILFVQVEHVGCQKFCKWVSLIAYYSTRRKY